MAVDIGPKIGIEGEQEFRKQIQQVNTSLKTLATESKLVASSFTEETSAEEKAAKQAEVLNKQIDAQKDKLKLLQEGLKKSAEKYGESDERTQKWQQAVNNAQTELNKMEQELKKTTTATDKLGDETDDTSKDLKGMKGSTDQVTDSMEDAEKQTKSWGDVMKGTLAAEAIKAGLSKLVDLTKEAASAMWDAAKAGASYADDILTLSTTTGLSTKTLQEYKYMADRVDVSLETITGSLTKVTTSMKSASKGTGDAYDAYKELGIEIKDSNGKLRKNEDVFNDIVKALKNVKNETKREQLAMTLLGKSAKDLSPLIEADTDDLEALKKEAKNTGYVLSNDALKALGKAQDGMDKLSVSVEGAKNNFAVGLAPAVETASTLLSDKLNSGKVQRAIKELSTGLGETLVKAAELASEAIDWVIDAVDWLSGKVDMMTEDDYELIRSCENIVDAAKEVSETYDNNAKSILDEKQRTEDLWRELQTLCDEEGNVDDANRNRAEFILTQLNEALGTEYELTGNQITRYQEMGKEIDELVKKKTAMALSDKHAEKYTAAVEAIQEARTNLARVETEQQKAWNDYQDKYNEFLQLEMRRKDPTIGLAEKLSIEKQYPQLERELNGLRDRYDKFESKVQELKDTEADLTATIGREELAQQYILEGHYDLAIDLYTKDIEAMQDYSIRRGQISAEQVKEMQDSLSVQEQIIKDYQKNLEAGREGYNEKELQDYKDHYNQTQKILDQYAAGVTDWSDIVLEDLENASDSIDDTGTTAQRAAGEINRSAESVDMSNVTEEAAEAAQGTEREHKNITAAVKEAWTDMIGETLGWIMDFKNQTYDIGKAIGQALDEGVSGGISEYVGTAINAAKNMIRQACEAAKKEAQINSPSKVTEQFGKYIALGLAEGMDDETGTVMSAAKRMTDAALTGSYNNGYTTAGIGTSSGAGSNSYTTNMGGITLQISGAGVANVDQLADKVAAKITTELRRAQRAR